jgi:hypothetical protein
VLARAERSSLNRVVIPGERVSRARGPGPTLKPDASVEVGPGSRFARGARSAGRDDKVLRKIIANPS